MLERRHAESGGVLAGAGEVDRQPCEQRADAIARIDDVVGDGGQRSGHGAAGVERHRGQLVGRRARTGRALPVRAIDRTVNIPAVGGRLAKVVVHRQPRALSVVQGLRGREVVAVGLGEIHRHGRDVLAGIEVERHLHALQRGRAALSGLHRGAQTALQLDRHRIAHATAGGLVPVLRQQLQAGSVDHEAVAVELELAVAAVHRLAGVGLELEETAAVDGDVQRVFGGGHVALVELLGNRRDAHADAGRAARSTIECAGVEVGKFSTRGLGTEGVGVGDVVADDLEVFARSVQSGKTLLEAHDFFLAVFGWGVWGGDQFSARTEL